MSATTSCVRRPYAAGSVGSLSHSQSYFWPPPRLLHLVCCLIPHLSSTFLSHHCSILNFFLVL
jgi:hypothetical protein